MIVFENRFNHKSQSFFNFKETYKLQLLKEDNWKNYNSLFPYPNSNIILMLYSIARRYSINKTNVHYAICLFQRYLGLRDINQKKSNRNNFNINNNRNSNYETQISICSLILACKMNETHMEYTLKINYLRIPLIDEFVGLVLECYFPSNVEQLQPVCQKILDFLYLYPKEYLSESFSLVSIAVVSIAYAIYTKSKTNQMIRWVPNRHTAIINSIQFSIFIVTLLKSIKQI
ncbi:hypothetical protein PPL_06463 [Heterostelium album PN500]|uniref:Cyclin N-terminal domain-containing protein n=1 Tax=Heterostelium pallidum (strain ATCC 26659 / Pp 5 / PN500) TaxID=670386 RepID=D3BD82_HETP5|nr:hypothetical protein PPL_06463 [Heterostelium album PN500]EFA80874.1 hypothetical protein PPL_06463 [Heterostelium album PN500]|eukprot:XP_020432993.1 hypothetical protein PPL_06463 [Heterostelium album PN500]